MTADDVTADEPTLAATRAAADQVRAANRAAYRAPAGDTYNVYERAGAAYELLASSEQLLAQLRQHVTRLQSAPGLFSVDDHTPADHLTAAAGLLLRATVGLREVHQQVNRAWSALSPLGCGVDDETTEPDGGVE